MMTMTTKWSSSSRPAILRRDALLRDAAAIAGVVLIASGLWLLNASAALIWCGAVLLAVAIGAERAAQRGGDHAAI